jgi:ferredoxin
VSRLDEHPTVRAHRAKPHSPEAPAPLEADELRALCLDAGADDVGFVGVDRPELADQRADIESALPGAQSLISIVCRTNVESIRSPARSVSNLEFHQRNHDTDDVARRIVATLERRGVRALNPSVGFPMEMDRFPDKAWVVSHKPVAVAAGLGHMGIHRNLIHPKFGNFVLLATVLLDTPISAYGSPTVFNPCLECKLCVAACPTGAISKTGEFNFSACTTHNYREFLGGFGDWVESVADADSSRDYRDKVTDTETVSMWQSLAYGPNYKAAYCVAVCPAGEDVIGPYLDDRKGHRDRVMRPLQEKIEPVYVLAGGDAEEHVGRRFPHKTTRTVHSGLRPGSIDGFIKGLPLLFQRRPAADLDATYHLTFTGSEQRQVTVTIRDQHLEVREGLHGRADLRLRADATTWVRFLSGRARLVPALLTGRVRIRGNPALLNRFARCFPS